MMSCSLSMLSKCTQRHTHQTSRTWALERTLAQKTKDTQIKPNVMCKDSWPGFSQFNSLFLLPPTNPDPKATSLHQPHPTSYMNMRKIQQRGNGSAFGAAENQWAKEWFSRKHHCYRVYFSRSVTHHLVHQSTIQWINRNVYTPFI